jgi:hypothetical protein
MPTEGTIVSELGTTQRFGGTTIDGTVSGSAVVADFIVVYDDASADGEIILCGALPSFSAAPAEEMPVEEAPAEETPTEEAPAEETPAEETPTEEAPAEEAPAEEAPAEEPAPTGTVPDMAPVTILLYDVQSRAVGNALIQIEDGQFTAYINAVELAASPGNSTVALVSGGVCAPPTMPTEGEVVSTLSDLQRFGGGTVLDGATTGIAADADYLVVFDDVGTDGSIILCGFIP